MLKSFLKLFDQSSIKDIHPESNDHELMIIGGIMVEAAAIDGQIDDSEIVKIKSSLVNIYKIGHKKIDSIVKQCLEKANEPNSLHYFSSTINKEFQHDKKINLIEILWEIILVDGRIHDFESNLIRRLAGLLYVSDIECGNAKKRVLTKISDGRQ